MTSTRIGPEGELAQLELQAHTSSARATAEIVVIGFATVAAALYQSVLVPLLGVLPEKLGRSSSAVEWLLTATLIVAAVATPVLGRLGDMFGPRRMLLVAVACGVVGSALCAVTSDLGVLIAGRAFQGAAMASVPLAISLAAALLPPARRATGIAIISATLGFGGAIGMPLSGVIADHLDFHWLFWITFAAGAVSLVAIRLVVPEAPSRTGGRIDLLGAVLLSGSLVAFLLPLAESGDWGWGSGRVLGLFVLAGALFALFGAWQLRTREPLVDLRAAGRKPLLMVHGASMLIGIATFASYLGTTVFVEMPKATGYGFGASVTAGGLCMLPGGLIMIPGAAITGRLINRRGATFVLALGAVIMAVGWVQRLLISSSYFWVVLGTLIVGAGVAMCSASLPSIVNAHTPVQVLGAANSLNNLVRSVGSSIASAVGGTVMASIVLSLGGVELPSIGAFRVLFAICAVASLVAFAIAALMPPAPRAEISPRPDGAHRGR